MKDTPFTLPGLREAYARGASPADVVAEVYARIESVGDPGIFIHLAEKDAVLAEARALGPYDPAKPLWGVPYAVKDNIDVAGMPTTAACPAFEYAPEADAFVVAKLRDAGALCIGKTNLDQFATGLVGLRTPYPAPKNALDPAIVPGGSSSGSAVAVAHGIVPFALGTDTAGSGRVPAALNGIVGLKPTLGALSSSGMVPACRTLDTISVFAQSVDDAYAVFEVASGYDAGDAYSRRVSFSPISPPPPAFRVGFPDAASIRFFGDEAQAASFEASLAVLREAGAQFVEIDFTPFYAAAELLYDGPWVAERLAAIKTFLMEKAEAVHPVTRRVVGPAAAYSAADAFEGLYRMAELKRATAPVLDAVDLLCVPTIPTFYSVADLEEDPIRPNSNLGTYTNFVNLLDLCGLAVPTEPRADGRPGGVTLLGAAGKDGLLASVARVFEGAAHPEAAPAPREDEIEIAVCGAHMSGLPLNGELTGRGARFLRAARTAPAYRFYALAGGPPYRPGLVRVADGQGASVHLEIWALPLSQFGSFMAGIPSPLGIGSVALNDGGSVKGFLCEAVGVEGGRDISALADWRLFMAETSARKAS